MQIGLTNGQAADLDSDLSSLRHSRATSRDVIWPKMGYEQMSEASKENELRLEALLDFTPYRQRPCLMLEVFRVQLIPSFNQLFLLQCPGMRRGYWSS